ncbi:hypothetical protein [Paenibacillus terrigena]|uniref:hypothetical protein n=1 Tax=Paenibacillus terrigena TaxID=369333 RepID=UPI0003694AEF
MPLVMFGLHQALIPIHAELIAQFGYTAHSCRSLRLAVAEQEQVGAAIMRNLIKGVLPSVS